MSQMKAADQAVIRALGGNGTCADCPQKHPQWASLGFGTLVCLECSGVHRSLGVHITFVRSIAMDSWTPDQLSLMKCGGNDTCNAYLSSKGIPPSTPIKQKYESSHAALYKEVLKARKDGRPEPTSLPAPVKKKNEPTKPMGSMGSMGSMNSISGGSTDGGGNKVEDPNGMERLTGETDQQYVARQTRLREEARARMAAKFGNGGGGMGNDGNGGRRTMGGVGSSPHPSSGDDLVESITSSFASGASLAASGVSSVFTNISDTVKTSDITSNVTDTGMGLWKSFSQSATSVVQQMTEPEDGGDGLEDFNRRMREEKRGQGGGNGYSGFGSDDMQMKRLNGVGVGGGGGATSPVVAASTKGAAAGGEDPNGIAPLTGESDKQYMERQIRIREEAKKRMEAKFGKNPSMGTAASSSSSSSAAKKMNVTKMTASTNDDFFSSFGA